MNVDATLSAEILVFSYVYAEAGLLFISIICNLTSQPVKHLFMALSCRWQKLKAALVERRSKLGESQNIQQVTRDAEDIEAWISEKLQSVQDESYMDPSNLQVLTLFVSS